MEYTIACVVLVIALGLSMGPDSVLAQLLAALRTLYAGFTYALSLAL